MRRANGDWFALEDHGQLCVPLFHSSQDAMMARLRNFGMLLFKPVALDARLLKEMAPAGDGGSVFCMVNDPFASLKHSPRIEHSELALLWNSPIEVQAVPGNGNGKHASAIVTSPQNEWWSWDAEKMKPGLM